VVSTSSRPSRSPLPIPHLTRAARAPAIWPDRPPPRPPPLLAKGGRRHVSFANNPLWNLVNPKIYLVSWSIYRKPPRSF
jgi:hypothetical protein